MTSKQPFTQVLDGQGNDVTAERLAQRADNERKATRARSAKSLLSAQDKGANVTAVAQNLDRSAALSAVSRLFALEFNRIQAAQGAPVADVDEMADHAESLVVKALQAEMTSLGRDLIARAKRITADDVRVLNNATGSQVRCWVPDVETGDTGTQGKGKGDRSIGRANVTFRPGDNALGRILKGAKVAPRALPKSADK